MDRTTMLRWITRGRLETLFWIALLAVAGHRLWPQVAAVAGIGGVGTPAPDVRLATLDGGVVSLGELRGSVVLVNFWATWCAPCRVEMPGFEKVWRSRRDDGFVLVGVSTDRTGAADVRRFLAERGYSYPVAMADAGVRRAFGNPRTLPTSFLIDRSGRIRHVVRGIFAGPALARAVDNLLEEPAP